MLTEVMEHKKLIELLPEFLRPYYEYRLITAAEQTEVDRVLQKINDLILDAYTKTATESGIEHKEKMYGIVPKPDSTLEERRLAVISKETGQTPYTFRQYKKMLKAICGSGSCIVTVDYNNYKLNVLIGIAELDSRTASEIQRLINEMTYIAIPANMVYESALFGNNHAMQKTFSAAVVTTKKIYHFEVARAE